MPSECHGCDATAAAAISAINQIATESKNDIHKTHCSFCIDLIKCKNNKQNDKCKLISCTNNCGAFMHECKLSEHLAETCSNAIVDCINKVNGCKLKFKREDIGKHIKYCVASVIRCHSLRMRRLANINDKQLRLKWPDPIEEERRKLIEKMKSDDENTSSRTNCKKFLNQLILEQDYYNLRKFAIEAPLKFHRMYGYLIGLKETKDYSQSRFSFMKQLLKNVKSKIFKDIETENCILFNDELGCSACQIKIKKLEADRFLELKQNHNFDEFLKYIYTYRDFLDEEVYMRDDFKKAYEEYYLKLASGELSDTNNNRNKLINNNNNNNNESQQENKNELSNDQMSKINEDLLKNNNEILCLIELNSIYNLNMAKELPCEAFQQSYELYRTNETSITFYCDQWFRRDEYSDHYAINHNLLSYSEMTDLVCPLQEYGCNYFKKNFMFNHYNTTTNETIENTFDIYTMNNLSCELAKMLKNSLEYHELNSVEKITAQNFLETEYDRNTELLLSSNEERLEAEKRSLLDLPFEVMFEIIDHLDSFSLYALSITCKVSLF
jgi:hypothetical protein